MIRTNTNRKAYVNGRKRLSKYIKPKEKIKTMQSENENENDMNDFPAHIIDNPPKVSKVTILVDESGARMEELDESDARIHLLANLCFATESSLLLEFIKAEGIPQSLTDKDGDIWKLEDSGIDPDTGDDFYNYHLTWIKYKGNKN